MILKNSKNINSLWRMSTEHAPIYSVHKYNNFPILLLNKGIQEFDHNFKEA